MNQNESSQSEPATQNPAALVAYRVTYRYANPWGRVEQWHRVEYAESPEQAREQARVKLSYDFDQLEIVRAKPI